MCYEGDTKTPFRHVWQFGSCFLHMSMTSKSFCCAIEFRTSSTRPTCPNMTERSFSISLVHCDPTPASLRQIMCKTGAFLQCDTFLFSGRGHFETLGTASHPDAVLCLCMQMGLWGCPNSTFHLCSDIVFRNYCLLILVVGLGNPPLMFGHRYSDLQIPTNVSLGPSRSFLKPSHDGPRPLPQH